MKYVIKNHILLVLLLVICSIGSAHCQRRGSKKIIHKRIISTSFEFTNFIFQNRSLVRNVVFISDDFVPSSYGMNVSLGIRSPKFLYAIDISIGTGAEKIEREPFSILIESEYLKFNPNINYVIEVKGKYRRMATFGLGPSLLIADFRRITPTNTSLSIFVNKSFIDFGWNASAKLHFFINKNLGFKIPIAFEYYHSSRLVTLNTGLGLTWVF